MNVRRALLIAGLWVLSTAGFGYAFQGRTTKGVEPGIVFSGDDLGFRISGVQGEARTGTLVVKIDGKWVEARSAVKLIPAK